MIKLSNNVVARIVREVLCKFEITWNYSCYHDRSPDVFDIPIPSCPACIEQYKHYRINN